MSGTVESVIEALRLIARDIAGGRPVVEARLLDAGGEVEDAALEAFELLDELGVPFDVGFGQVAVERSDAWLLLLAEAVGRVVAAASTEELEAAAWSVDTLLITAQREANRP